MSQTQFYLITGLSGSGKSLVHNCFEDMGYYCVDNLPISLIGKFFELVQETSGEITRVAVVTDVRERSFLSDFVPRFQELRERFINVRLLFLEASEDVLTQRFSETRRPHPLAQHGSLKEALRLEREKLEPVRELADVVIDTSRFNVHEMREYLRGRFAGLAERDETLRVSLVSFGFKHGIPRDADLLFDVRFLKNPHFIPEFRGKTGLDPAVRSFVLELSETGELLDHLRSFLFYVIPLYVKEGKSYLTIGIGCTGGKHRSVAVAEALGASLKSLHQVGLSLSHRDVDRG